MTGAPVASAFSDKERGFLTTHRLLGRLATIDPSGQPHVVPVGWSYNIDLDTIDVGGRDFARTRKFRNILRNQKVCIVIDDVLPPWQPRCVQVRGDAEAMEDGGNGGGAMIRITPTAVVSWGI